MSILQYLERMKTLRRLSAVLAADVVNYSGQMKADENQTLEQLRKLRKDVLDPLVSDHRGNIVKRMGHGWTDGVLTVLVKGLQKDRTAVVVSFLV